MRAGMRAALTGLLGVDRGCEGAQYAYYILGFVDYERMYRLNMRLIGWEDAE